MKKVILLASVAAMFALSGCATVSTTKVDKMNDISHKETTQIRAYGGLKAVVLGPVFFKQERVTKDGKHFMILKFRSMIVDAEKDGRPHPAGEKDDRITHVGSIIRACRVDELPQLFNIFAGDMSIVGPRPERYEHVIKYTQDIPEFKFREKVKGGLTGYAQVYGKYNTSALDKLKLDLTYIANYSVLLDFQIIFETIKILFQKESTEGSDSERAKEMHDADCK
jgi:lipopolysaccharide/colanic/teichoic acid biosynthesis glycosyltransferase